MIVTRGVKREKHSPAQSRYSLPVPHPTSEHVQLLSNRPLSVADPQSVLVGDHSIDLSPTEDAVHVIKVGLLSRTAQRQRDGASRREVTQKRRFRLTEDAFEYFPQFSWNVGLQGYRIKFASLSDEAHDTIIISH